jgi:XTP/dITP diphosphohydrolase
MMANHIQTLLIGTGNQGKFAELSELLSETTVDLLSLSDVTACPEPEETGTTFEKNAVLKASHYAAASGLHTLADDSGLEIEALGGEPGVMSARFGGFDANYKKKINLILDRLSEIPGSARAARFVCVMALANPDATIASISHGIVEGRIAQSPRGTLGFGYDPIFIPSGSDLTFAEMSSHEKHLFSHRRKALDGIVRYLHAQTQI